jgi:hypothetical protein
MDWDGRGIGLSAVVGRVSQNGEKRITENTEKEALELEAVGRAKRR